MGELYMINNESTKNSIEPKEIVSNTSSKFLLPILSLENMTNFNQWIYVLFFVGSLSILSADHDGKKSSSVGLKKPDIITISLIEFKEPRKFKYLKL